MQIGSSKDYQFIVFQFICDNLRFKFCKYYSFVVKYLIRKFIVSKRDTAYAYCKFI